MLCQLVVELPVVALHSRPLITPPSHLLASPFIILSLQRPLIVSLHRLVIVVLLLFTPRLVLSSRRTLVFLSSSHCATLLPSNRAGWLLRPLTAPPFHRLIMQIVALPLAALSSCLLVVPNSHPLVVLSLCLPLVISSCRLVVAPPFVAPPSRPLVVLLLHHHLIVLHQLVVALPLVAPPSRPLVMLPSCPLVEHQLVVVWPPSNNATDIECPPPTSAIAHRLLMH